MERVRKRIQNALGNERIYFKRSKYLINKNKENLKPEELIKLETMLEKTKDLVYAYMFKECFSKLLKHDALSIRIFLDRWLELAANSGLKEFKNILTT